MSKHKRQKTFLQQRYVRRTPAMSHPIAQPLRPLTEAEREALQRVSRAHSDTVIRHQRAIALLSDADGISLIVASRASGCRDHETATRLIRRISECGLATLD